MAGYLETKHKMLLDEDLKKAREALEVTALYWEVARDIFEEASLGFEDNSYFKEDVFHFDYEVEGSFIRKEYTITLEFVLGRIRENGLGLHQENK